MFVRLVSLVIAWSPQPARASPIILTVKRSLSAPCMCTALLHLFLGSTDRKMFHSSLLEHSEDHSKDLRDCESLDLPRVFLLDSYPWMPVGL